ncbi:hypothetical protein GIB67_020590 [Kingdonia uniflora]|uniref:Uncharacterized protein n=1 Tax=Kingdonia uniflora TaxID=39325 RepID=A0A7J7NV82_9MAGN|nr:hypothetical protein GIB67_020590 [Kingdonia uniflora]
MEGSGFTIQQPQTEKNDRQPLQQNELLAMPEEPREGHQQAKIYSDPLHNDNPMILELCGTLFPNNPRSVWRGPHSLACPRGAVHKTSAIHAAIATLMK